MSADLLEGQMLGWLLIALLPWIVVGAVVIFGIRDPRPLPPVLTGSSPGGPPLTVAVIIPARNEARNIEGCLASLASQEYPSFSVTVVDDRSTDDTGARARSVPAGHATAIRVVDGDALPEGWFGKPWACLQGARDAVGEIFLFTDADTRHDDPRLLARSVQALREDEAQALSLIGRQELNTFWEKLLQPQVFALLGLRFRRMDRPLERTNCRDAIANGQYLLVSRKAYEAVGGHTAVKGEVVEDLRIAQLLTQAGFRLTLRDAMGSLSTRMYRSLREIVEGWTKNIAVGARQSAGWLKVLVLPAIVGFLVLLWMVPPAVLLGSVARAFTQDSPLGPWTVWSAAATLASVALWIRLYARFEVPFGYALLFPFGSAMAAFIVLRSWVRGERRIEWKGRRYVGGKRLD